MRHSGTVDGVRRALRARRDVVRARSVSGGVHFHSAQPPEEGTSFAALADDIRREPDQMSLSQSDPAVTAFAARLDFS